MKHMVLSIGVLLLGAAHAPTAQGQTFGAWSVNKGTDGSFVYATTLNDSAQLLGQYCYIGEASCVWVLGMTLRCDKGDQYVVLVNSDTGATSLKLLCDGPLPNMATMYRYAFTSFDEINEVVLKNRRIGFAFPLQGDQFRVTRFDLNGAPTAVDTMRADAIRRTKPARQGTRDEKL